MGLLHVQTTNPIEPQYARRAVDIAQEYIVPNLYEYQSNNVTVFEKDKNTIMRRSDILIVNVTFMNDESNYSVGYFNYQDQRKETEMYMIFLTLFITMVWFFGVAAFTGPVMYLVVIPIERMILLLSMLMKDPLGYQSTRSYMTFMSEEDQFTQNSQWTKDVLKGMETSFLMSTILRIGSLMKVGFGSAGVDIIRKNLEKGLKKEITFKNLEGSMVSCVFLFSDIRQFTDATECLKEEVFVFTNKIAEVVHSICNSYGGAANKNIGDAFLVSWALDNPNRLEKMNSFGETLDTGRSQFQRRSSPAYTGSSLLSKEVLHARHNQAEKALLSVVKICIALHNDDYFLESLSDRAKQNLKDKLQKSPIVQMGFGLHAGAAVQGAIGSQRKIDATFISEAVELSESLEGLTKRYGVEMLMSGQFHSLLPNPVARKCRKIDQIIVNNDDEDEDNMPYFGMYPEEDDILKLYTYDMDIKGYYVNPSPVTKSKATISDATANDTNIAEVFRLGRNNSKLSLRDSKKKVTRGKGKFTTPSLINGFRSDIVRHTNPVNLDAVSELPGFSDLMQEDEQDNIIEELILPNGPALYHADIWTSKEFRRLRSKYEGAGTTFPFLKTYESGLTSYYHRDWELAHDAFSSILARFDDGPSRYFLGIIDKNDKIAPRNFSRYGSIH